MNLGLAFIGGDDTNDGRENKKRREQRHFDHAHFPPNNEPIDLGKIIDRWHLNAVVVISFTAAPAAVDTIHVEFCSIFSLNSKFNSK